ncbi:MAG: hypothetical protein ACNA7V_09430 [Bacteroidales bacterium]
MYYERGLLRIIYPESGKLPKPESDQIPENGKTHLVDRGGKSEKKRPVY